MSYRVLFCLFTLALVAFPARAQSETITFTADRETITVGDPVILTLTVVHPLTSRVIVPRLETNWGNLEVRSQGTPTITEAGDGTAITTAEIVVTAWAPGTYPVPVLPVTVANIAGEIDELVAPPLMLTVESVLVPDDTTLRDIKPQAALMSTTWGLSPVVMAVGGGLIVLAAVLVFVVFGRKRLLPDNRPPYQVAIDELARIEKLRLVEQQHYDQHYELIADCLRRYLERQHDIPAVERTTAEIRKALVGAPISGQYAEQMVRLLNEADMVKFAKADPDPAEARTLPRTARHLIGVTRPAVDATKGGAA